MKDSLALSQTSAAADFWQAAPACVHLGSQKNKTLHLIILISLWMPVHSREPVGHLQEPGNTANFCFLLLSGAGFMQSQAPKAGPHKGSHRLQCMLEFSNDGLILQCELYQNTMLSNVPV